jgi:hypothetical protein
LLERSGLYRGYRLNYLGGDDPSKHAIDPPVASNGRPQLLELSTASGALLSRRQRLSFREAPLRPGNRPISGRVLLP